MTKYKINSRERGNGSNGKMNNRINKNINNKTEIYSRELQLQIHEVEIYKKWTILEKEGS